MEAVTQMVETANVRSVKNAVRHAVNRNGLMAVVAEVGSGKTTMFNWLANWWNSNPEKFRLITVKSFDSRYTKIGIIMGFMLEALNPGAKIPSGNERRYRLLQDTLERYAQKKYKIILMIDEAQDMRLQTFYDIKKIHEITAGNMPNVFSVILFGKTSRKWNRLLGTPELGYRLETVMLDPLTEDEILKIAEDKHGLRFESSLVRKRFSASLKFKTPLSVAHFCAAIKREAGVEQDSPVTVDADLVLRVPMLAQKLKLRQAGKTQAQFADYCRQVSGRKINLQRISEYLNGRLSANDPLGEELARLAEQFIADAYQARDARLAGVR